MQGNAKRALASVRFWYPYTPYCLGPIRLSLEFVRQFTEPALLAICLDVRKVLTVHPRCALVGSTTPVGVLQYILAIQLVVQQIEAIARRSLRFGL
jgi:hypothetical protein